MGHSLVGWCGLVVVSIAKGTELEDVLSPEIIANTWGVGDPAHLRPVRIITRTHNTIKMFIFKE